MSKVMFFAHDAGGANAIVPLISEFPNALIFAKGPAVNILPKCEQLPKNVLYIHKPDFLITGTSYPDLSENELWSEATKLKIKSMAILDYWVNYKARFSKCYPQYFVVMDELAKKEAIAEGVPENIILPFGNPHFEHIAKIKGKFKILYASQANNLDIPVIEDLISIAKENENIEILIRNHPRESADVFSNMLKCEIDTSRNSLQAIMQCDIVVSTTSMLLLEALLLGKKAISYLPNAKTKEEFALTKNEYLPFINNISDLKKQIIPIPQTGIVGKIVNFVKGEIKCPN